MPEISRFYGIVIRMYYNDHAPPHFHACYGSEEMLVSIETLDMLAGSLPSRAKKLVMEWAQLHHSELPLRWQQARNMEQITKIAPLT